VGSDMETLATAYPWDEMFSYAMDVILEMSGGVANLCMVVLVSIGIVFWAYHILVRLPRNM